MKNANDNSTLRAGMRVVAIRTTDAGVIKDHTYTVYRNDINELFLDTPKGYVMVVDALNQLTDICYDIKVDKTVSALPNGKGQKHVGA
jgi:hypothetical protein